MLEQVMVCCEMLEQVMECCEMLKSHLTQQVCYAPRSVHPKIIKTLLSSPDITCLNKVNALTLRYINNM